MSCPEVPGSIVTVDGAAVRVKLPGPAGSVGSEPPPQAANISDSPIHIIWLCLEIILDLWFGQMPTLYLSNMDTREDRHRRII